MCEELGEIYQDLIEKIVLYGSYVRAQETSESDVDMAVILKNLPTDKQHDKMTDLVVDYELELGVTLSVISIEYFNFIEWKETLPFCKSYYGYIFVTKRRTKQSGEKYYLTQALLPIA